ncbi:MAG: ESPR-type extended signal peptide-containing protein, partial [Brachymonas sp.]|nr:ESPR-type extended signal peptide-containing protein [Brachymonas sp.]
MNHIYKTVWNATLGTWTAVQETAKSHGKTSSGKAARAASQGSLVLRFAFTLVASAALLLSGRAMADALGNQHPVPAGNGNHYCYYDATSQSVICGDDATKTVNPISGKTAKAIVIGKGALNTGESSMAIGLDSRSAGTASLAVGNSAKAGADQAVAVGQHAQANGKWDVSIGRQAGWNAKAPNSAAPTGNEGRNIAIGDAALKNGLNVNNNMAMGTSAGENLTGTHNVIIGTYANADEAIQSAIAAGSNQAQINFKEREVDVLDSTSKRKVKYIDTSSTVAIGHRALATSAGGVAVGQQAKAFGATTVAIGNSSRALGNNAVAMGNTANAGAAAAIAIGHQVNYQPEVKNGPTVVTPAAYKQAGASSIAIGTHSHSSALRSIAIGTEAKATGDRSTALGNEASAGHVWSVAIGHQAETRGKYALAIGPLAKAGSLSVADGNSWGMAIGYNAEAGGWGSPIAIGTESKTLGESPVAIGDFATAEGNGAVAIGGKRSGKHLPGQSTYAKGVQTTALGYLA